MKTFNYHLNTFNYHSDTFNNYLNTFNYHLNTFNVMNRLHNDPMSVPSRNKLSPDNMNNSLQRLYADYSEGQGRNYNRAEQRVRLGLFRQTLQTIAEHNSRDETWQMGLNQFSDMVGFFIF